MRHTFRVTPRFHVPTAHAAGTDVTLPEDEGQHAARVLRVRQGQAVRVFDGAGLEFEAVIASVRGGTVVVHLSAAVAPVAPETRVRLTLAQAVLKADGMDDVVRDAVMLGVSTIVPLVSGRSEVSLAVLARGHRRERWARIAVASAKQCGRAVVPAIAEPVGFDAYLAACAAEPSVLMLVEPSAAVPEVVGVEGVAGCAPASAVVLVGPEGGWTPEELASAARCRMVRLGGRTLRADAAPLVALSALLTVWGEF